jgi:hypothetical protein
MISAAFMYPSTVAAQQPSAPSAAVQQGNLPAAGQQVAVDVEDAVRKFRVGVRGGVGLDPELIDLGAHATFGPIFTPRLEFRPGIEFGFGEITTLFGINADVIYRLRPRQAGWAPYIGAGPNFTLSHRGFQAEEGVDGTDTPSRFDFGDTDFTSGLNFIVGMGNRRGTFFEMNATAYGVSNIRLLAGFNF